MNVVGLIALSALLGATVRALVGPSPAWIAVASVLAVGWPFLNGRWEGPVLLVPVAGHGLTLSDLLTPLTLALLAGRVLLARRRSDAPA
ncbi:MAG: hypothetical protein WKF57_09430 [Nakamurella sp.]